MNQFEILRLVLECGIEMQKAANGNWHIRSSHNPHPNAVDPAVIISSYKLRPLVCTYAVRSGVEISMLLPYTTQDSPSFDGKNNLDVRHSMLIQGQGERFFERATIMADITNLEYVTGAAIYHCKRLAQIYSDISHEFAKLPRLEKKYDNLEFGGQSIAFYEFDALITVARRVYDTSRYIIWKVFGPGRGSIPASFKRVLPLCTGMPEQLKHRLDDSWQKFGARITDYRDCIQHYVPVDYHMSSVRITEIERNVWSVSVLIPDNPEAKSRERFQYTACIDALTYGCQITTELIDIASEIMNCLPKGKREG